MAIPYPEPESAAPAPTRPGRGGGRSTASALRNAFALTLIGGAVEIVGGIAETTRTAAVRKLIQQQHPKYTAVQVTGHLDQERVALIIIGLLLAAVWFGLAVPLRSGRLWAKSLATALLAAAALFAVSGLSSTRFPVETTGLGMVFAFVRVLIGLAVVILVWLPAPQPAGPPAPGGFGQVPAGFAGR